MAFDFPANPTIGQLYAPTGGPSYAWNGTAWSALTSGSGFSRTVFTATAGQTSFSLAYTPGSIDVFRNGVKLAPEDFVALNGTSITLANGCNAGDTVEVVAYAIVTFANSATKQELAALVPPGAVMSYAGSSAPDGWLMCDGSAVSRATYAALFAAIGTTYGTGNGSTTFNLPGASDRVIVGKGTAKPTLGAQGGATSYTPTGTVQNTTLTEAQMPSHGHGGRVGDTARGDFALGGSQVAIVGNYSIGSTGSNVAHAHGLSMNAMSVEQPFLVLNHIIKT